MILKELVKPALPHFPNHGNYITYFPVFITKMILSEVFFPRLFSVYQGHHVRKGQLHELREPRNRFWPDAHEAPGPEHACHSQRHEIPETDCSAPDRA